MNEAIKLAEGDKYIVELVDNALNDLSSDEDKLELLQNAYIQADLIKSTNKLMIQLFRCIPEILRGDAADLVNNHIMRNITELIKSKYHMKEVTEITSIDDIRNKLITVQTQINKQLKEDEQDLLNNNIEVIDGKDTDKDKDEE